MAVRVVRTEDPAEVAEVVPLRLEEPQAAPAAAEAAPVPVEAPPVPQGPLGPSVWQAAAIQAVAITSALAEIVSIRFVLILGLVAAAALAGFGEHTILGVVNAALFDLLVVVPLIALALRKG